MRLILAVLVVASALAATAGAAGLDPRALVLRQADVPAGFKLDRGESGVRTNERESTSSPQLRPLFARWGRVTGYEAVFELGNERAVINSRVDVFRSASGSESMLRWADREVTKSAPKEVRRAKIAIGASGWIYWDKDVAVVAWRFGRVFAGVSGEGVSRARTIALARTQQRRMAAALR